MREHLPRYEVRIQGHIAPSRLRQFEGITVCQKEDGETVIVGHFPDQAALYGLLSWLQRLGVTLLLVQRLEAPASDRDAGSRAREVQAEGNQLSNGQ